MEDDDSKIPDPIDVHVGQRVRARRKMMGYSQTQLGKELGVTFQQVQKYERGMNRIGSSRLFRIAGALDVPISYFFEGADAHVEGELQVGEMIDTEAFLREETQDLVKAYYRISDPRVRKKVLGLARLLATGQE